jgi:hypothetical protein
MYWIEITQNAFSKVSENVCLGFTHSEIKIYRKNIDKFQCTLFWLHKAYYYQTVIIMSFSLCLSDHIKNFFF